MHPSHMHSELLEKREKAREAKAKANRQDTNGLTKRKLDDMSPASKSPEAKRVKANEDSVSERAHPNGDQYPQPMEIDQKVYQEVVVQQPTPQETSTSLVEIKDHQGQDLNGQSQQQGYQQQGYEAQNQNQNDETATHPQQITVPLVCTPQSVEVHIPGQQVSDNALQDQTENYQSQVPHTQSQQQQNHEIQNQSHNNNNVSTQSTEINLPLSQTPHDAEMQIPCQPVSNSALQDQEFVEALYRHLETPGPQNEFKSIFESRLDHGKLDTARKLVEGVHQTLNRFSSACEAQSQIQTSETRGESLQNDAIHNRGLTQQSYGYWGQHIQPQNARLMSEYAVYDSIQNQQSYVHYVLPRGSPTMQIQEHSLPAYPIPSQEHQQSIYAPQAQYSQATSPHLHQAHGQAQAQAQICEPQPELNLPFLQTAQEKAEYQQAFTAEYSRLQTIQEDQDTLGRLIVSKRDHFLTKGILFENLAQLYWDLLDAVEEAGGRSRINDWVEDLSIQLLEMLQRMEEDEVEIRQLEVRFGEMARELIRIF